MAVTGQVSYNNPSARSFFSVCDIDEGTTSYYGYVNRAGNWYIMREVSNAYRYAAGYSDYPTAWSSRSSIGYDYFDNILIT